VLDPMHMSPEDFARLMKADYDKYESIVRQSGAKIE
jgi:tripartite-type tricarboxylate transporter receptor subunit TctC